MTFRPMCKDEKNPVNLGHTSNGYLLPCCWIDGNLDEKLITDLYKPHLKLDNVDDIDEILLSKEWIAFYKSLEEERTATKRCRDFCTGHGEVIHGGRKNAKW